VPAPLTPGSTTSSAGGHGRAAPGFGSDHGGHRRPPASQPAVLSRELHGLGSIAHGVGSAKRPKLALELIDRLEQHVNTNSGVSFRRTPRLILLLTAGLIVATA
jgi:hypothetical protein